MIHPPFDPNKSLFPAVSQAFDPSQDLLRMRALEPPSHPGLLGSLGHYEVRRVVGWGGMGVVVLGHDNRTDTRVAIKLLRQEFIHDPQAVFRFHREAQHMKELDHSHILKVLEVSDRPEGPYFVMPYMERGSLASLIQPEKPLAQGLILSIVRNIAGALVYAHGQGIIHRDIKPANILLGEANRAFLADFGLVRTFYNDLPLNNAKSHCEGTSAYLSPALAAGKAEDTRGDIYSFGAMLYELLAGRPPYQGRSPQEILLSVQAGPPEPLTRINVKLPSGLIRVVQGAMGRELRDRYASMADIEVDLERVARGLPPLGPAGPRFWFLRKGRLSEINYRKCFTKALTVVALIVILGLVWALWPIAVNLNISDR